MRIGRSSHAAYVVEKHIFVAGGVADSSGECYIRDIGIYSTASDSWTYVNERPPFRRKSFGLLHVCGTMYAVGGDAERTVIWNDTILNREWLDWLGPITHLPTDLQSYDVFALGVEIFVVGKTEANRGSFRKFHLARSEWTDLPSPKCPWSGGVRVALLNNRRCENEGNAKRLRS